MLLKHIEKVEAAFAGSDAFSQRAICQVMLRKIMRSSLPSEHGTTPGDVNCRVVYIHDKDEIHGVSQCMTEVYLKLGRCLNYMDLRKRKMFRGEKDPGKAKVVYRGDSVMIIMAGDLHVLEYAEVINDRTRLPPP
jgi:hypothetical protein